MIPFVMLLMLALVVAGARIALITARDSWLGKNIYEHNQLKVLSGCILSSAAALIFGIVFVGYDQKNECWVREREKAQTELHGLCRNMLDQYIQHDVDFFLDVISEEDDYIKYNALNPDEPVHSIKP